MAWLLDPHGWSAAPEVTPLPDSGVKWAGRLSNVVDCGSASDTTSACTATCLRFVCLQSSPFHRPCANNRKRAALAVSVTHPRGMSTLKPFEPSTRFEPGEATDGCSAVPLVQAARTATKPSVAARAPRLLMRRMLREGAP